MELLQSSRAGIDNIPIKDYIPRHLVRLRGACREALRKAGRRTEGRGDARPTVLGGSGQFPLTTGAAPAGRSRKPAPGPRRGSARGYYGASARSWLTAGGPEMGSSAEARPDVVMKTPPTVRREAAALSQSAALSGLACVFRRAVPPLCLERGARTEGEPGASNNTGDDACPRPAV